MASQEMEVEGGRGSEVEDEGGGTQRALGSLEFRTQDAEPSGNMLFDARKGFNNFELRDNAVDYAAPLDSGGKFRVQLL